MKTTKHLLYLAIATSIMYACGNKQEVAEQESDLIEITNQQFETDKIVIRTKDKHQLIEKEKKTIVAFFLIPNNTNLVDSKLKRTNFKFCGWAKVECNNEQII